VTTPIDRPCSRIIVLDARDRILLFASRIPDGTSSGRLWAAPGGALEPDETWEAAARRELREETGLDLPIGPCVWHRENTWYWAARGWIRSLERYFIARTDVNDIDDSGWTPLERELTIAHRWWTVDELASTRDLVAPRQLALLLPPLLAGELPATPIQIVD
jgi:8-oxo-dGTP pyrophosphatase MutT (NUDIX family)